MATVDATIETRPTGVTLTERAAEKVRDLMAQEPAGEAEVLRVAIQGGGCGGFEYQLGFDRGATGEDAEFDSTESASSSTPRAPST